MILRTLTPFLLVAILLSEIGHCQVALPAVVADPRVNDKAERCKGWIRGLIQNELHCVDQCCTLTDEDRRKFVDLVETEWQSRSASMIKAYANSNYKNQVDLESRVEKLVSTWLSATLSPTQIAAYEAELASRMKFRRKLVIGKMVCDTEKKLGLTAKQMEEMTVLLDERWKDSWWGMYRAGSVPETKFSWITSILSESQRTTGNDRGNNQAMEFVTTVSQVVEYPSKGMTERFSIGSVTSSDSIDLAPKQPSGNQTVPGKGENKEAPVPVNTGDAIDAPDPF